MLGVVGVDARSCSGTRCPRRGGRRRRRRPGTSRRAAPRRRAAAPRGRAAPRWRRSARSPNARWNAGRSVDAQPARRVLAVPVGGQDAEGEAQVVDVAVLGRAAVVGGVEEVGDPGGGVAAGDRGAGHLWRSRAARLAGRGHVSSIVRTTSPSPPWAPADRVRSYPQTPILCGSVVDEGGAREHDVDFVLRGGCRQPRVARPRALQHRRGRLRQAPGGQARDDPRALRRDRPARPVGRAAGALQPVRERTARPRCREGRPCRDAAPADARDRGRVLRHLEVRRDPALDVGALRRRRHPPPRQRLAGQDPRHERGEQGSRRSLAGRARIAPR